MSLASCPEDGLPISKPQQRQLSALLGHGYSVLSSAAPADALAAHKLLETQLIDTSLASATAGVFVSKIVSVPLGLLLILQQGAQHSVDYGVYWFKPISLGSCKDQLSSLSS